MITHRLASFRISVILCGAGLFVLAASALPLASQEPAEEVLNLEEQRARLLRVEIRGPISPSALETLTQAIRRAERESADALLVILDTPGGLVSSMDEMNRSILASTVPVITFVSPPGSTCGSAGVYIMYASHIAAMAPATNIGSATPVQAGGGGGAEPGKDDRIPETAGADDALNMKRKLLNHAKAQMRALASYHGRNAEFAVRAVTHADNITSEEALSKNVIDVMAESEQELLEKISGRTVRMVGGPHELASFADAEIETIEKDFRRDLLDLIASPQVAMILMSLGMLGIFAELVYSPGAIFPGAIGAICLILGLYALQSLSVDYTGLALIGLGIVFFILELNVMSYGLLSVGGTLCITLGSIMLMRSGAAFVGISLAFIIFTSLLTAGIMGFLVYLAAQSHGKQIVSGQESMVGDIGEARKEIDARQGSVFIHSELWQARTNGAPIPAGERVKVVAVEGLSLRVERAD